MSFSHLCKADAVAAAACCVNFWRQWRSTRGQLNFGALIQSAEAHVKEGEIQGACALLTWLRGAGSWSLPTEGDGLLTWIQLLTLLGRLQAMQGDHVLARENLVKLRSLSEELLQDKLQWLKARLGAPEMLSRIALRWKGELGANDDVVMMHIKGHFLQNHMVSMLALCECHELLGDRSDAKKAAGAAVDLAASFSFVSEEVSYLLAASVVQDFASDNSDYNSAELKLLQAESWFSENFKYRKSYHHGRVVNALAGFYSTHGSEFKAYVNFMRAAKIFKLNPGVNDLLYADCLANISTILGKRGGTFTSFRALDQGLPQDVLSLLHEALRIYQENFPQLSPHVAEVLSKLGAAYSDLGQSERSLSIAQEALQIFDEHGEVASSRYSFALHALAVAMCRVGSSRSA